MPVRRFPPPWSVEELDADCSQGQPGATILSYSAITILGPMSNPLSVRFKCPNCEARYEVVRIEEPPRPTHREVTCLSCGGPLLGRDGRFLLKYFLIERPKPRAYDFVFAQSSQKGRKL
jgi:hypothetical protein